MIDSDLSVHSDDIDPQQLWAKFKAVLSNLTRRSVQYAHTAPAPRVICAPSLEGIMLAILEDGRLKFMPYLPTASDWPSCSTGYPRMVENCGQGRGSVVLSTPVQAVAAAPRAFCLLPHNLQGSSVAFSIVIFSLVKESSQPCGPGQLQEKPPGNKDTLTKRNGDIWPKSGKGTGETCECERIPRQVCTW